MQDEFADARTRFEVDLVQPDPYQTGAGSVFEEVDLVFLVRDRAPDGGGNMGLTGVPMPRGTLTLRIPLKMTRLPLIYSKIAESPDFSFDAVRGYDHDGAEGLLAHLGSGLRHGGEIIEQILGPGGVRIEMDTAVLIFL